ncbi:spinster family MFS transporter [Pseudomonas gingeri]
MNNNKQASNAWIILLLLFLANLLNFFDRAIPAIIIEPLRKEWHLTDFELGAASAGFTLIYALAGLPLGRLADRSSRKAIIGWGLIAWSGFTALNALAWNFLSGFLARIGVGVGEASYAPAANSLIGDLFPPEKRARAIGIFMLGLPVGTLLAFVTVGLMVQHFGSWRAPFVIASIPGVILGVVMFFIREPARGASEAGVVNDAVPRRSVLSLLSIPTFRWLIVSGITLNIATYAGTAFLVPLFQRHFQQTMTDASVMVGLIVGATGLVGLTVGGWCADILHQRYRLGRMMFGMAGLLGAGLLTGAALLFCNANALLFAVLFGLGWLLLYNYYTSVYPAIQDVVGPRQRATAIALYFACMYVLGGAFGPMLLGALSDHIAQQAMVAAGAMDIEPFKAVGLYTAMFIVPVALLLTAVSLLCASRSYLSDVERLKQSLLPRVSPRPIQLDTPVAR